MYTTQQPNNVVQLLHLFTNAWKFIQNYSLSNIKGGGGGGGMVFNATRNEHDQFFGKWKSEMPLTCPYMDCSKIGYDRSTSNLQKYKIEPVQLFQNI